MVLVIQALLGAMVALINFVVIGVLGSAWWIAFVLSVLGLGVAWFCYLVFQAKHPDWWPPWDEGLPQTMRMSNAFVPVLLIYIMALWMLPVFQSARQNAERKQKKQSSSTPAPSSKQPKRQP